MRAWLNGNGFDAGSVSRVRVLATIDCQHKTPRLADHSLIGTRI